MPPDNLIPFRDGVKLSPFPVTPAGSAADQAAPRLSVDNGCGDCGRVGAEIVRCPDRWCPYRQAARPALDPYPFRNHRRCSDWMEAEAC